MLYITTRSSANTQTAPKALLSDRGDDGGLFVPFQIPAFTGEEIAALAEKSFGQTVAEILNLFFACRLTDLDVEFTVGRQCVNLFAMNHRILVAETWRNPENCYDRTERTLAYRVCDSLGVEQKLTSWLKISVRIAVLFGIFGELLRGGMVSVGQKIDIAVSTGDFSAPISAWYARQMGLPIGNIICSCNENNALWELLHLGELHCNAQKVHTTTPLADMVIPAELERLIHVALGTESATDFANIAERRGIYRPGEEQAKLLRKDMFAAVVSRSRLDALIPSVYRTNSYILGAYTTLAYGGLMDYRAKTGETRPALLLSERSPLCDGEVVAEAMQLTISQLRSRLD